ncbi:MAG: protease modulator HflC [bacterium]
MAHRTFRRIILIVLAVVLLGVGLVSITFFTVDEREFVVVTQFGKPLDTHKEAGLYCKLPSPLQSVTRFDRRIHVYQTRLVESLTGDRKNIIIQAFACWRITDPLKFFQAVRIVPAAEQALDDILSARIGATLGEYNMSNLFSIDSQEVKVEEMETKILKGANEGLEENYGFKIVSVGFRRFALPDDNARTVYERMRTERNTIANKYRAEGQEQRSKIEAEADRERSDILSQAYKEAETLRGEGDARAAQIYAEAYGRSPELFDLIRTMDTYKKILTENTTVILSADSDLFKFLNAKSPVSATEETQVQDVR